MFRKIAHNQSFGSLCEWLYAVAVIATDTEHRYAQITFVAMFTKAFAHVLFVHQIKKDELLLRRRVTRTVGMRACRAR